MEVQRNLFEEASNALTEELAAVPDRSPHDFSPVNRDEVESIQLVEDEPEENWRTGAELPPMPKHVKPAIVREILGDVVAPEGAQPIVEEANSGEWFGSLPVVASTPIATQKPVVASTMQKPRKKLFGGFGSLRKKAKSAWSNVSAAARETVSSAWSGLKSAWEREKTPEVKKHRRRQAWNLGAFGASAAAPVAAIAAIGMGMSANPGPSPSFNLSAIGSANASELAAPMPRQAAPQPPEANEAPTVTVPAVIEKTASTVWEKLGGDIQASNNLVLEKYQSDAPVFNQFKAEKGKLFGDAAAYQNMVKKLKTWGGYSAILDHAEAQGVTNLAQLINVTDAEFGENVADHLEAQIAAASLGSDANAQLVAMAA